METENLNEEISRVAPTLVEFDPVSIVAGNTYVIKLGLRTNCFSRVNVISNMDNTFNEHSPKNELTTALFAGWADDETLNIINKISYQLIK